MLISFLNSGALRVGYNDVAILSSEDIEVVTTS